MGANQLSPDYRAIPADVIRAQVERILESPMFAAAPRMQRLLAHLVDHSLGADDHELKEYALGVEVFDRGPEFDPRTDTIVRVQAGRLRRRLKAYYDGPGKDDPVAFEIPPGHYRVTFRPSDRPGDVGSIAERRHDASELRPPLRGWIAAVAAAVIVLGIAIAFYRTPVAPVADLSIAVLPFSVVGHDPATTTLAKAMTEELRTAITAYPELESISAPDVVSPRDVVDASYAVGGNVQRLGERVRLRVSLTRTTDDEAVWSEAFDRPWAEAQADPAEIARTAGRFVRLQLLSDQGCAQVRRLSRIEAAATALCAAIAEGNRLAQIGDGDSRAVLSNAQRAAALDPDVALSYALIASSYVELAAIGRTAWQDATREAQAALDVGRALAPNDPMLLQAQAQVQQLALNYVAATATYERLRTNPLYADTAAFHVQLGGLAMARGDVTAALDHYRRAQRIVDFVGPWYRAYAGALWSDGQHRAAIEIADAGLALVEVGLGRYFLYTIEGFAYEALGETTDAEAAFKDALAVVGPTWKEAAAVPLARLGRADEARTLLARVAATENPAVLHMVHGYAALNSPQAFEWIRRAIDGHVLAVVTYLRVSPIYAELRQDPRWNQVMAQLEAEEAKGSSYEQTAVSPPSSP